MADRNGGSGYWFWGFVIGGLVGGIIALLNAPRSGEETREQIRVKGNEMRAQAEDRLDATVDRLSAIVAEIDQRADELRVRSTAALQDIQKQWTDALDETRRISADAVSEMQETVDEGVTEIRATAAPEAESEAAV